MNLENLNGRLMMLKQFNLNEFTHGNVKAVFGKNGFIMNLLTYNNEINKRQNIFEQTMGDWIQIANDIKTQYKKFKLKNLIEEVKNGIGKLNEELKKDCDFLENCIVVEDTAKEAIRWVSDFKTITKKVCDEISKVLGITEKVNQYIRVFTNFPFSTFSKYVNSARKSAETLYTIINIPSKVAEMTSQIFIEIKRKKLKEKLENLQQIVDKFKVGTYEWKEFIIASAQPLINFAAGADDVIRVYKDKIKLLEIIVAFNTFYTSLAGTAISNPNTR